MKERRMENCKKSIPYYFGNHCLLLIAFVSGSVQGRNMYLFTVFE